MSLDVHKMIIKQSMSKSSNASSSNHTSSDQNRIPLQTDRMIKYSMIKFNDDQEIKQAESPKQTIDKPQIRVDYDEDEILADEPSIAKVYQEDARSTDSLIDTHHLQRHSEMFSSYVRSIPANFANAPTQISPLHYVERCGNHLKTVSEHSSESFEDTMKLRLANRATFNEQELISMVFDVLIGLRYLELHQNNLRNLGEADLTSKDLDIPSEMLYISPSDIGIFINSKKKKQEIDFKLANYFEQLIMSPQTKQQFLRSIIFGSSEDLFFFPPELLIQLFLEDQQPPQKESEDYDFYEEQENVQTINKQFLTCAFRGPIWSLGIMLLRCFYSSQGNFFSHLYPNKNKLNYITDLLSLQSKVFQPVLLVELDGPHSGSPLDPWISGSMSQNEDYSWAFKHLISQLLTFDVKNRPSISELLESQLFKKQKIIQNPTTREEPLSLGVFLSLMKLGLINQVTQRFFSDAEIIDIAREPMFQSLLCDQGFNVSHEVGLSVLRGAIQIKVNQVCADISQQDCQQLNVEELVSRLQRLSQIPYLLKKKNIGDNDDTLSIKSEIIKPKKSTALSPPQSNAQTEQLSKPMLSRMNIFSRVGLFTSKKSTSPEAIAASDTQSTNDQKPVLATPLNTRIAQLMLLKLLSSASDKNFKTFMGRLSSIIEYEGLVFSGVRRDSWARGLQVSNEEAQREVMDLSRDVCGWYSMSKYCDSLQIEKDVPRVHQYDWLANSYYGRILMSQSLRAFISLNEYNCYIQGMDSMILIFLKAFDCDWQLAVLCLQELYRRRLVHSTEEVLQQLRDEECDDEVMMKEDISEKVFKVAFQRKLQEKVVVYRWVMMFLDPQLYNYLEQVGFVSEMYVVSWFTNFFSMDFEIPVVFKIWDMLFLSDDLFEVYFAASLMCELRETLLLKDSNGIMSCIKNLQGIINIQLCLQYAQHISHLLPRSLTSLNYATATTHKDMQSQPSEFIQQRPWETPPLWGVLASKSCFQINVFELLSLVRETRNLHPSHLLILDLRTTKNYEEFCIGGSIHTLMQNNKISNQTLLKYIELKNQITGTIEQFKDSTSEQPHNIFVNRNSPAHKPLGFVILVWDYQTQALEIDRFVNYFISVLQLKRLCVLKGGIQAAVIDGSEALKFKNKPALPIFIKKELEELKCL